MGKGWTPLARRDDGNLSLQTNVAAKQPLPLASNRGR
jgi:hypothetical protein